MLKNGSKGEEVKELQKALVNAGYNIKVDGIYGKQTEAAVKEYQQKNGLKVDGLAGKQTKGSLGLASNTSTSSNVSAKATAPTSQTVLGNTSSAASKPMVQNTSASVSPKKSTQQNTPTSNTGANAGTAKQNTAPVNNNTNIAVPITSPQNNPVYSQPKTTSNYQQTAQANVQASKTQPEAVSKAQGAISKSNTVNEQPKTVDNKAAGVYNDAKSKVNEGKAHEKISVNVPAQAVKEKQSSILDNILDTVQFGLDLGGLIPGIGEPLDLVNAGIYLLRKDYLNAGLSASSVIPLAGVAGTVGKFINKGAKAFDKVDDVYDAAKAVKKSDDIYDAARGEGNKIKSVEDVLNGATIGRVTKGKTTQYIKPGDFNRASNEFDSLKP